MLIALLIGHAFADFVFQSGDMAKGKNRNRPPVGIPPGQKRQTIWPYWLTSHAAIHATAVYFVTGSVLLASAEFFAHWMIDFGKCENWYGIHADQSLHFCCKVMWWGYLQIG